MNVWFFVASDIFFAAVAIYFSFRYEKKSGKVFEQEQEIRRRVFELTLLQEITNRIGYSLNIQAIAETISLTVEELFDVTTVSYATREDSTISIKTFKKEPVDGTYISELSKIIISAMSQIEPALANDKIQDSVVASDFEKNGTELGAQDSFMTPSEAVNASPQAYFNIPLVLDNRLIGMINISSRKKIKYNDEDTALLYKIVDTAQDAIQRLHNVINNEELKLDSLILALPFGTIMFTVEVVETPQGRHNQFNLSVINQSAIDFLRVKKDCKMEEVLNAFGQSSKMYEKIQQVFTTSQAVTIGDAAIFDRDFSVFINPVFEPGGQNLVGVAVIMRDISSEKKLERVRADFTDMMMHELRAPLTAIRGAAALLLAGALPPSDKQKMPRIILDSSNDMLSTVSDFLDAAKIDEGKFKLAKVNSNLAKMITDHIDVFSYAAREKNISFSFDSNQKIPDFMFDPIRIGQVLNNLISNSIKFTNEGGKIDIKIEPRNDEVEVIVTDNGIGIPDSKKAILFTKFGQIEGNLEKLRSANSRSSGSSGLGLFISRQIVDAHGGKIWLDSTENVGTSAHFTLPLIHETPEEALPAHPRLTN